MSVNQTSLFVYWSPDAKKVRDTVNDRILHFFNSFTRKEVLGWTACQVATYLSLPVTSVRPRLTDGVSNGIFLAIEGDMVDCEYCGKKNQIYRVK